MKKEKILLNVAEEKNEQSRLKESEEFLENQELEVDSYDEDLVRKLIESIEINGDTILVEFKSGIKIEVK